MLLMLCKTRERRHISFPSKSKTFKRTEVLTSKPQSVSCQLIFMTTFVCYGQFLATFSTAGSQYAATIGGSHSLTETVFVASFSL